MDLARSRYSRDLKVSVMRAMDAGESGGRVARRLQISPKLIKSGGGRSGGFSGGRPSSPVSTNPSGECIAIVNR
jgi:hypothetical protein